VFADGQDGVSTISEVTVHQHPYRKHRTGFLLCLGLLVVLAVGCATMGGVYLYYRYSRPEGYHGACTIRFNNNNQPNYVSPFEQPPLDGMPFQQVDQPRFPPIPADDATPTPVPRNRMLFPEEPDVTADLTSPDDMSNILQRVMNAFRQEFELDLEKQLYEVMQVPKVPELGLGRPARFIHDFGLNLTAILDMESHDCYILPLNRSVVKPPKDLFELIRGLNDGTFTVDGDAVRETYIANPLAMPDPSTLGPFIARECRGLPTYMLINRDTMSSDQLDRVRRDVAGTATDRMAYGEFAGNSLHTVHIIKTAH